MTTENFLQTESYKSFLRSEFLSCKHSSYFETYDVLFQKYRGEPVTIVEIGVKSGGSLFMWRDYFGSDARIIGVELNPSAKKWESYGFEIFIGSQSDEEFWDRFIDQVGQIDILIDDGGHTYEQQIITVEKMISSINDGGVLVVEDTHTSYMDGFGPRKWSFIEYSKNLIDRINSRHERYGNVSPETRIWSIEFFDSIVALKVNSLATADSSRPISNRSESDNSLDYRYEDGNRNLETLDQLRRRLRKLKRVIPFAKLLSRQLENWIGSRGFKARRFFK